MIIRDIEKAIEEELPKINASLAEKASKNEIGTPLIASSVAEMVDITKVYVNTTDKNWYSWGGSSWIIGGVYNSYGISNKSITEAKTNFINIADNNLLINYIPNKYINVNPTLTIGAEMESPISWATDFIFMTSGETIYYSNILTSHNIVGYDINKQGLVQLLPTLKNGMFEFTLSQDSSIRYIRLSMRYEYMKPTDFFIGKSKEHIINYSLRDDITVNSNAESVLIYDSDIKVENLMDLKPNLFNPITADIDKEISIENGNVIDKIGAYTSDYISVKGDYIYSVNVSANSKIAFYDVDKVFIKCVDSYSSELSPVNTKFMRVSQRTSNCAINRFKIFTGCNTQIYTLSEDKRIKLEKLDGKNTFKIERFAKEQGDTSDSERIQRAMNVAKFGTVYISNGTYGIDKTINNTTYATIKLDQNAKLKAIVEIPSILKYDGSDWNRSLIVRDGANDERIEPLSVMISGGIFDGNGVADCIHMSNFKHFTFKDSTLLNGKKHGLLVGSFGHCYELVASNIYAKCTMPLKGNIGIKTLKGDSHYTDIIVVDYTIGIEVYGGSNRLTRCHTWGGIVPEQLENSINFKLGGGENTLTDCYADTAKIGYEIKSVTRLLGCNAFNNYSRFGLDDVIYIKNETGQVLRVMDGCFTKMSPNTIFYQGILNGMQKFNDGNIMNGLGLPS